MSNVVFVDCETISLSPDEPDVIWEVGAITPDGAEHHWFLPVDLGRADPRALEIGRFYERYPQNSIGITNRWQFARQFEALTRGCHLAGAVVSFDEERLRKLLRRSGAAPGWHYHLCDVEAMAVGFLAGRASRGDLEAGLAMPVPLGKQVGWSLPWNSSDLSRAVGVDPDGYDKHTALADARWARDIFVAVMGQA